MPTSGWPRQQKNHGAEILRRGYSFTDGVVEEPASSTPGFSSSASSATEEPVRGDPATARKIDALNEYIKHTSSAVFAIPPGAREGGYVGEDLFS